MEMVDMLEYSARRQWQTDLTIEEIMVCLEPRVDPMMSLIYDRDVMLVQDLNGSHRTVQEVAEIPGCSYCGNPLYSVVKMLPPVDPEEVKHRAVLLYS